MWRLRRSQQRGQAKCLVTQGKAGRPVWPQCLSREEWESRCPGTQTQWGGACVLSRSSPCPTLCDPRTIARQIPLSMGFSRHEYWNRLRTLLQGIFPTQGSNLCLLPPALRGEFFATDATWEAQFCKFYSKCNEKAFCSDLRRRGRAFSGGQVANTPSSQCRGPRFNPLLGN